MDTLKRDDNPPNVPQRGLLGGLLGRYEAGGISRRLGGSSEAKLKIRIAMALNKIDLEVLEGW